MPFGKNQGLTDDQAEELEEMFNSIMGDTAKLNDWEKGFIEDNHSRYEQYGKQTYLSAKQWEIIYKIYKKVQDD